MFWVACSVGLTSMRVRRPPHLPPIAARLAAASHPFRGRSVDTPLPGPSRPAFSRNAPVWFRPKSASTVRCSAPLRAPTSGPRAICPKRAIAAHSAARRLPALSAASGAPPGGPHGICPNRATAAASAARRSPSTSARPCAPPSHPEGICPKRAVAVAGAPLRGQAPPTSTGARPSRPRGICPKGAIAPARRTAAVRLPSANPAP